MNSISEITEMPEAAIVVDGPVVGVVALPTATRSRLGEFYELSKPRMNFLVLVTTMVGYFMATRSWGNWPLLFHTLLGTGLTAAGSAALNQFIERDQDRLMKRTVNRPVVTGRISANEALWFGLIFSAVGLAELAIFVNLVTAALGALTLGTYVLLYTPMKKWTPVCTLVGAIPGALPPMMGWTAAHGWFSGQAGVLFAILFVWQIPHFMAIAILYRDDYAAGGFKMLPVVDDDLRSTSKQILLYGGALIPVSLFPTLIGMTGIFYFLSAVVLGLAFFGFCVTCAQTRTRLSARRLFFASIIYLPALLAVMMLDKQLVGGAP